MHESSLAKGILSAVLERAHREAAVRVHSVCAWIAETERLSSESVALHFAVLARGTVAEEATLHLDVRHIEARCSSCTKTYLPEHHVLVCPRCDSTDGELLGSTGIGIDTMDVEG